MNTVHLIGNLTRDPELSQTSGGVSRCTFSIAVNRRHSNAQGDKIADFFNIVAWRGLGENCNRYLAKGKKVRVTGELQNRTYEVDDQKRYATYIVADEVEFLSPASKQAEPESLTADPKSNLTPADDEELPF